VRISAVAVVVVSTLGAVASTPASAAPGPADEAFERGRALMAAGKIDEACGAFADSLRLDFQYGTLFNLAQCDERRGKLATAFDELRRIAREDTKNPARADRARELAAALEPRLPRLHVTITGPAGPGRATIDGSPLDITQSSPLDLGSHDVVVAGMPRTVVATREGEIVELAITAPIQLPLATPSETVATPRSSVAESPRTAVHRHTPALITIGGGVAVTAVGLVLGAVAWKRWDDAKNLATTDPMAANRDVSDVRALGNTSTVFVAIGAVAIAVGVYLWRR